MNPVSVNSVTLGGRVPFHHDADLGPRTLFNGLLSAKGRRSCHTTYETSDSRTACRKVKENDMLECARQTKSKKGGRLEGHSCVRGEVGLYIQFPTPVPNHPLHISSSGGILPSHASSSSFIDSPFSSKICRRG